MRRVPGCLLVISIVALLAGGGQASSLDELDWLVGHWALLSDDVTMEEWWTDAKGGTMLGLHRDVFPDGKLLFEYLRIEERGDGLVYVASPGGASPTEFPAVQIEPDRAVFENPEHDFPQRIVYERDGETLVARIGRIDPDDDSGPEWRWKRVSP